MPYRGDILVGDILYFGFTTVDGTGLPTSLLGTPVVSIHKDDDLTQSTAGVTLSVDFDGITGRNHIKVDTSADGTFYSAASDFSATITTGTVDGISVIGYEVGEFSIENRTQKADIRKISGSAVSTSSAQLGVNAVQLGATAQTGRDIGASVLLAANGLTKNAAFTALPFIMRDEITRLPTAGFTVSIQRKIGSGAFAAGTLSAVTDAGSGVYTVDGLAADSNGNYITFLAIATGADDTIFTIITVQ